MGVSRATAYVSKPSPRLSLPTSPRALQSPLVLRPSCPRALALPPATRHLGPPPATRNGPEWDALWASEPLVN